MTLDFLGLDDALAAGLHGPDVYYGPRYGSTAELIDGGVWECAATADRSVFLPYVRRSATGMAEGEYDIVSPYGYAGVAGGDAAVVAQFRAAFHEQSRERGLIAEFLRTNPFDVASEADVEALRVGRFVAHRTYAVDNSTGSYWDEAEGRHRTAVRKAERLAVQVERRDVAELAGPHCAFRRIYDLTMDRVGAGKRLRLGDDYFRRLVDGLAGELILLAAVHDGETTASSIFLRSPGRLHYHLSGATPDGLSAGATNLLLDTAIREYAPSGTRVHLGGGVHPGDGLDRFKRSVANIECTVYFCQTVVNETRYRELTKAAGDPRTDYFPAYRA